MAVAAAGGVPVSCFIIARNEARRIGRVIETVRGWADEVVVVDSGSTDGTQEIARGLGARVVHNDWPGYGPQKRFAEDQCRNDWLLNLDADEVPTDELCQEIVALFADGEPPRQLYLLHLPLVYPGCERPRRWANDHNQIRLYDRRAVRFSDSAVHDTVDPGGLRPGQLCGAAWHYSYPSYGFLVAKFNEYTDMQARSLGARPGAVLLLRLPFEFPLAFLKFYVVRRHFMGGAHGFIFSMVCAFSRFLRIVKFLEMHSRRVIRSRS